MFKGVLNDRCAPKAPGRASIEILETALMSLERLFWQ